MKTIYSLHEILLKTPNIPAAFWIEKENKIILKKISINQDLIRFQEAKSKT